MQGLCDEHDLVYRFKKDSYPITFTIKPAQDMESQMSMLENVEDVGYRSPDASMTWIFEDGTLTTKVQGGTFTIGKTLRTKIEAILVKMINYWQQFFFRDIIQKRVLTAQDMLSTPFKNAVFRRNEMSFFAGQHAGVYSLDYRTTCRLEARQVLIYQCILDLTGENDKYNHSKAAHLYPPFSYIPRSAKNYKIEPALTWRNPPTIWPNLRKRCPCLWPQRRNHTEAAGNGGPNRKELTK